MRLLDLMRRETGVGVCLEDGTSVGQERSRAAPSRTRGLYSAR